uniref:EF-hand domain-containing protein n=1 Tax=Alexandrium monilatum TaxID=311494 RepID=A0A7S4PZS2_9DINO
MASPADAPLHPQGRTPPHLAMESESDDAGFQSSGPCEFDSTLRLPTLTGQTPLTTPLPGSTSGPLHLSGRRTVPHMLRGRAHSRSHSRDRSASRVSRASLPGTLPGRLSPRSGEERHNLRRGLPDPEHVFAGPPRQRPDPARSPPDVSSRCESGGEESITTPAEYCPAQPPPLPLEPSRRPSMESVQEIAPQHPLVSWFEREVRPELEAINRKLDVLGANGGPKGGANRRKSVRKATLRDPSIAWQDNQTAEPRRSGLGLVSHTGTWRSEGAGNQHEGLEPPHGLAMVLGGRPTTRRSGGARATIMQRCTSVVPEWTPANSPNGEDLSGELRTNRRGSTGLTEQDEKVAQQAAFMQSRKRSFAIFDMAWNFLEDPDSSWAAEWFAIVQPFFIMATVFLTLIQTLKDPVLSRTLAAVLETTSDGIFLLEFIVRLATCPSPKAFICSFYALVDLAALAFLPVRLVYGPVLPELPVVEVWHGLLLFAVPIVRLLKTLRRFQKFHLLLKAFNLAAEALPVLLFILFFIALVFSVLVHLAERDQIESLPLAFWFTIVTMTTVGYGDIYPTTDAGILITSILIIITVLYMAIPLGIVGEAFAQTWQDRDRILLMQRTRDRLRQWGYSAKDIPILFSLSDVNGNGVLSLNEFRQLLSRMHIGFSSERVMKLFASLDSSQKGTINARAFVRGLFPEAYHEIFVDEESEGEDGYDSEPLVVTSATGHEAASSPCFPPSAEAGCN